MKSKRRLGRLILLMFTVASIYGCLDSGKYGRLTLAGSDMTIQQLVNHWDDYHLSYAGVNKNTGNAVLFDPKGDDRGIALHTFWAPVKDKSELLEIIDWMGPVGFRATLYKIMGPGDQVFGYIYMLTARPLIKVVDEKTLWIGNITLRDFKGAGQN